jgi:mannosyltransferase OCH1-like enzyme
MNIPKVIYQTWKTKNLHPLIENIKQEIQNVNSNYKMELFDDDDMDAWIKNNCNESICEAYNKLHVGAAKADLWRYLILYQNGGVYLDMDSIIYKSLDELIQPDESAIISREGSRGYFMQWMLVFEKGHPILKSTIDKCVHNINNPNTTNIVYLTGPGVFTEAINEIYSSHTTNNLWDTEDDELNLITNNKDNKVRSRFLGISYSPRADWKNDRVDSPYADWKHDRVDYLYQGYKYWRDERIFK